jgi:hypothetical protein
MPIKTLAFILALILTPLTHAETIKLKLGEQGQQEQLKLPQRGMSMDEVQFQFGEPKTKTEPRGEPPISSWHYPEFAVYFERRHVLHSVLKHHPNDEK